MDTESLVPTVSVAKLREKTTFKPTGGFFQIVRQLHAEKADQSTPGARPIGKDYSPDQELIRFHAVRSLAFPASEIENEADLVRKSDRIDMNVTFMGLTGPSAVLPDHYSEMIIEQHKERNDAMRNFFDIFNHRSVSFFYRAWMKYRLAVNAEQYSGFGNKSDPITASIIAMMGINTRQLKKVQGLDIQHLLYYAGHFVGKTRNAVGLSSLVSDFLSMPVKLNQLTGEWLDMEVDDRVQLPDIFGRAKNNVLGQDFVIGEKVFCVENHFEVVLGPMKRSVAEKIRPGSKRQRLFCALIDLYAGYTYQYDVIYLLKGGSRPRWGLDKKKRVGLSLGWNTWLPQQGRSPEQDEIRIPYSVIKSH